MPHDWDKMITSVQNHVKSINWAYKKQMITTKCDYYNYFATFEDKNTLNLSNGTDTKQVTADIIIIAVGGRPTNNGTPGETEYTISSDDLFSLKKAPGKTLFNGGGFIGLECAGFLTGLGYDTTVIARSVLLGDSSFDPDFVKMIGNHMCGQGTRIFLHTEIESYSKAENGQIEVKFATFKKVLDEKSGRWVKENKNDKPTAEYTELFDTVLVATGRTPCLKALKCEEIGVKLGDRSGKMVCNEFEQSSVDNIYGIGDVREGGLELTPVAIKAGKLLVRRLFKKGFTEKMDYVNVPSCVFTPLEYGFVGYSELQAAKKFGSENLKNFHSKFQPLEWQYDKFDLPAPKFPNPFQAQSSKGEETPIRRMCYVKVTVNINDKNRVLGFHIVAPNAGEITQAVTFGLKCGMTKDQMDQVVGIHPVTAEVMIDLDQTKEDNPDAEAGNC